MIQFKHNGNKDYDNRFGFFSSFLLIVGIVAIVFFISLLDSLEDALEYWFEILLVSLMGLSTLRLALIKRAELDKGNIAIDGMTMKFHHLTTPLTDIHLDIYLHNGTVNRYHIWDNNGAIAIYSTSSDELVEFFKQHQAVLINEIELNDCSQDSPMYFLSSESRSMSYNIDTGHYYIKDIDGNEVSCTPDAFALDPNYKKLE